MGSTSSQIVDVSAAQPAVSQPLSTRWSGHPRADGKFLRAGVDRLLIKGVTYGTFAPGPDGHQFPPPDRVAADFAMMAAHGINTVRTYTVPPPLVLDEAARQGVCVMAGVPWTQHVAFLADRQSRQQIAQGIVSDVKRLAGHPALLMVALGNEIPPGVVRWHGRDRVEAFLHQVFLDAKAASPDTLFTYVNFPPTEFLDLPFFDVAAFNIYLHHEEDLRAYVTRLQHIAGPRPLLLAELGSDSIRQGQAGQAALTSMQLDVAYRGGACGAIAFAWTDEWWRGGFPVEDWDFGLVDRDRAPKKALATVTQVFSDAPFSLAEMASWPTVSVVVCAYNAAATIDECLTSLAGLTYPHFEVIVINDGSRDGTGEMARRHGIARVIDVPNGGLSVARNLGFEAASGEIVAYTDADVRVDPDWLTFLVQPFLHSDVVGSGGPNVVPADDPWMAQCVARAPGGPAHVLLDDNIAEHVPGCNMAFRRDALIEIGGFNPIYLRAGDDVDMCWRLQARGWRVGFAPAALVWHRHRRSIAAYVRQQRGYGEGEAWLAPHHPDKFIRGHAVWQGRIYSPVFSVRALSGARINAGTWGLAAFPSVYLRDQHPFEFVPHRIGWMIWSFVMVASGIELGVLGRTSLAWAVGGAGLAAWLTTIVKCAQFAWRSDLRVIPAIPGQSASTSRLVFRATIAWLYFLQPLARAAGRLSGTISGVRHLPAVSSAVPGGLTWSEFVHALSLAVGGRPERHYWSDRWTEPGAWLTAIAQGLRSSGVSRGIEVDDGWQPGRDVSVEVGRSAWLDLRTLTEDHGSGKRLGRLAFRLRLTKIGWLTGGMFVTAVVAAAVMDPFFPWLTLAGIAGTAAMLGRWMWTAARVISATVRAVDQASIVCGLLPVD